MGVASAPFVEVATDGTLTFTTTNFPQSSAVIVSPPLGIDNQENYCCGSDSEQKSIVFRVLDILKGARQGSDLTKFQVPPQFNLPKSQVQCYAEQVYCCGQNLLEQCVDGATSLDRFLAVVRWHISLTRPAPFAKAPYNPILGETHHVTSDDLNLVVEQVSHHPPVTVLYATNQKKEIQILHWNEPLPKFYGSSVEVTVGGRKTLTLAKYGEMYEMTSPKLCFRFFPHSCSEWVGDTTVRCVQTGIEAVVSFKPRSFLGLRGGANRVSGKITRNSSGQVLYTLNGCWDETVMLEDKETGKKTLLYDAKAALTKLKNPVIKNPQKLSPMESAVVWSKLTKGILVRNWEMARQAKTCVEEKQRTLRKRSSETGEVWKPKYFYRTAHGEWEWALKGQPVPEGPIEWSRDEALS